MPNEVGRTRSRSRGIALVAVLWAVVLLSALAASFVSTARTTTALAHNQVESAKASAIAEAGIFRTIAGLIQWSNTRSSRSAQVGDAAAFASSDGNALSADPALWRLDGTAYRWRYAGADLLISIQAEDGKIDLNAAPRDLLKALLLSNGVDEARVTALVDGIADFRDRDSVPRLNGAEDDAYRAAGLAYGAKDAPFEAIEELEHVLGMTRTLYEKLAPALTVHSGQRGVNAATAPAIVLGALPGLGPDRVADYIETRGRRMGAALPPILSARGYATGLSQPVYTIRAEARTESGAVFVREAIVRIGKDGRKSYRILGWQRGRSRD